MDQNKSKPGVQLPVGGGEASTPSFGCVVYVSRVDGRFHGRVANLAGIQAEASDQRTLLGKIVPQFKAAVAECMAEGRQPDWIDPPTAKRDEEQKLFLPVHL